MEFKGTKGEWRYSKEHECITTSKIGIVEGSKTICQIKQAPSFDYTGVEALANAQLIAAAPELLEALIILVDENMLSHKGDEIAQKAINKALGLSEK